MSKYTIKVSPTLTDGANYKSLTAIPSDILAKQHVTVLMYPGVYTAPTNAVYDDIAFIGIGERAETIVAGDMTIANTTANTTTFTNISFVGSNAAINSGTACVTKIGAASAPLLFKECTFSNAVFSVSHNSELTMATTNKQVIFDRVDSRDTDRCVVANANVEVSWSALNTSANSYFQKGTGGVGSPTVTVTASTSGGANAGGTLKVVKALLA